MYATADLTDRHVPWSPKAFENIINIGSAENYKALTSQAAKATADLGDGAMLELG